MLELARASLPFELTGGQEGALDDLLAQMAGWPPMQCLLQVRAGPCMGFGQAGGRLQG